MTADTASPEPPATAPVVVVYQNPDFVVGLLQAILNDGILESIERESEATSTTTDSESGERGGQLGGKGGVPGVAGADGSASLKRLRENANTAANTTAQRMRLVFSQTYYFNVLRQKLQAQNLISNISSLEDARKASPGDIVEFSTTFRANEINAVLDIANPDLVATVTRYVMLRQTNREMRDIDDHQALAKQREIGLARAADAAELSSAIAAALRKDFRSEHTREFYGLIAEGALNDEGHDDQSERTPDLTAVTVCETEYFRTQDPDRLLDGRFTVLGKVVSTVGADVPVLQRNKLLDRINPDFLSGLFENLDSGVNNEGRAQRLTGVANDDADVDAEGLSYYVDMQFSATVAGESFAVLPIAIYA